jgi:two-component system, sensor histidine kinase
MKRKLDNKDQTLESYLIASGFLGITYVAFFIYMEAWLNMLAPSLFTLSVGYSWLIRIKNRDLASTVLISFLFFAPAFCCFFSGGPYSPLIIWLLPTGLMSAKLLGKDASIKFAMASLSVVVTLFFFKDSIEHWDEFKDEQAKLVLLFLASTSAIVLNAFFGIISAINSDRSYQKIEKLSKVKSSFLASMSHEMRTPLNAIIGISDSIMQSEEKPEVKENIDLIKYSGEMLLNTVNTILEFSKVDSGMIEIKNEKIDFHLLLKKTFQVFENRIKNKGLTFSSVIDQNVPKHILSDYNRIGQVLNNILGNAFKYTDSGDILINVKCRNNIKEKRIIIEVIDTGIGISKEDITKVFLPFERGRLEDNSSYEGTGVGLSTVKEVLSKMGGKISLKSVEGEGTQVKVEFPFNNIIDDEQSKEIDLSNLSNHSILVVEDNVINQKVVEKLLFKLGVTADFANNGQESIELLRSKTYQTIFMDLNMPIMGGLEATRIIREEKLSNDPYIIALTANAFSEDKEKCFAAGMDAFLSKPLSIRSLREALIVNVLEKKAG